MKIFLTLATIMVGVASSTAAAHGSGSAIAPGTEVELMVLAEVNTRISRPGAIVRLRLNKPVMVNDVILLPVGTPAFGKVEAAERSGVAGVRGTISVRMTHIEAPGGHIPLVDDLLVFRARGGKNDDAAKVLLAPIYAPFAPANSAKLKAGDLILARIAEPKPGLAAAQTANPQ